MGGAASVLAAVAGQEATPTSAVGLSPSSGQSGRRCRLLGDLVHPVTQAAQRRPRPPDWASPPPRGPVLSWVAPHRETKAGGTSHSAMASFIPSPARWARPPSPTPSQRPILAGRAGGHPGPRAPAILIPGVQHPEAADCQGPSQAVGNRARLWNASSPGAGPAHF